MVIQSNGKGFVKTESASGLLVYQRVLHVQPHISIGIQPYGSKDSLLGMHGKGTIWGVKYLLRRYLDP